jgi:SNF2 family DNA or RNA helicase
MEAFLVEDKHGVVRGRISGVTGHHGQRLVSKTEIECESLDVFEHLCTQLRVTNRPRKELVALLRQPFIASETVHRMDWTKVPQHTMEALYEHQRIIINDIIEKFDGRGLIAAMMGSGKSLIVSLLCLHYGGDILVVGPLGTLEPWKEQFAQWAGLEATIVKGCHNPNVPRIAIVCYNTLIKNRALLGHKWRCVVFDESHYIKNPEAQRTMALQSLSLSARCVLMISATPRQKCHSELYTQIVPVVGAAVLGNFDQFAKRYCSATYEYKYGHPVVKMGAQKFDDEIHLLLSRCMVRAEAPLPPKTRHYEECTLSDEEVKVQEQLAELMHGAKDDDERNKWAGELWRTTGKQKIPHIIKWMDKWMSDHPGTEKLIVFYHSQAVGDALAAHLTAHDVSWARIDGKVNPKKRHAIVKSLQTLTDHTYRVGLLTYGTCALGITLCPACTDCVMAELIHTPTMIEQCEGKLNRLGAIATTRCYWIVATNSHDMSVMRSIQRKTIHNGQALDGAARRILFDHKS